MKGRISQEKWSEIVNRVKSGERVEDVAKDYGISGKTIYNKLSKANGEDHHTLKISKLERENKQLKELIGLITFELNKEKKEI